MKAPTERFSDRVDAYVRYRPAYPEALIDSLIETCRLDSSSVVADIGSGTGILTRLLLANKLCVFAVEPNEPMRQAAEELLSGNENFTSINGQAEESGLADCSVDLIVAAQAFHWFRQDAAYREFTRILKIPGWVALIWNQRKLEQPFQRDYDALLSASAPEYDLVNHMNVSDRTIAAFYSPHPYQSFTFENRQVLDRTSFLGRMKSASYLPPVGTAEYVKLLESADQLFAKYQNNGKVSFEYDACLHIGKLQTA